MALRRPPAPESSLLSEQLCPVLPDSAPQTCDWTISIILASDWSVSIIMASDWSVSIILLSDWSVSIKLASDWMLPVNILRLGDVVGTLTDFDTFRLKRL